MTTKKPASTATASAAASPTHTYTVTVRGAEQATVAADSFEFDDAAHVARFYEGETVIAVFTNVASVTRAPSPTPAPEAPDVD